MICKQQPYFKRMLAVILSVIMLFTQLPMYAFSVEASEEVITPPASMDSVETPEDENTSTGVLTLENSVAVETKTQFLFIPEKSGVYCFYSTSDSGTDPLVRLWDADENLLAENDDGAEDLNFELHYELTAGTTYYVEADAYSNKFPYTLWVKESDILSIEIVAVPTFTVEEYDYQYGGWSWSYGGELVDRYFRYYPYSAVREAVIRVNYKDGTSMILGDDEEPNGVSYEWDFYNNPWTVGTDNHYYITYKGLKALANATVTASPVKSIEVVNIDIPTLIEHDESQGGWSDYYQGVELDKECFFYELSSYEMNIRLLVTYNDGTTEQISYYDEEQGFAGITLYYDQIRNPWTVGSDNEFEIWYRGASITENITVMESPVESIRIISGGTYEYNAFDESCGYWMNETQGTFYYYPDRFMQDVVLEVTYTDGSTEEVAATYENGVSLHHNQYDQPWEPDGDNELRISYKGASITTNVTIKPSNVKSIFVEDVTVTEGTNCSLYPYDTPEGTEYYYHYDINPQNITVELTDGTVLTGNQHYIWQQLGSYISIRTEEEQHYGNTWGVGEHKVTASLLGQTTEFLFKIEESNIASFEVEDLEIEQYNCGYWQHTSYWDDETGENVEVEWYRYEPSYQAQITVTFHDDTPAYTGSIEEFRQMYGIYAQIPSNQRYDNQWQLDQTYSVKAYLGGKEAEFSVTIVEPNVKSIEVIDTQDFAYYENDTYYGEWQEDYFYYDAWELASRVTIRVTYKDGTTEDISWVDENGMHTGIGYSAYQHEAPWTVGGENLLTITYGGAKTTISAVIIQSPIKSIVVDPITHTQNTGGHWNEGGYWENGVWIETDKYYFYSYDPRHITITYLDGTVISGTRDEIHRQTGVWVQYYSGQNWENQWGIGTHTATISFMGKTAEYTVTIVESDIAGITAPSLTVMEGTGGYFNSYHTSEGEENYWYYYNCTPDEITVTYKDGSSVTGTFDEICELTGYYPELITDQRYDAPWGVGTHTANISFMGATGTFDVIVTPTNVESIVIEPITYYEYTNGHWNDYYDEDGYHQYYYYGIYLDNVTVTYDDGTVVSGNWDEIYNKTGCSVTVISDQSYDNQWGVGAHTVQVYFCGASTELVVNIVQSPIESIAVDTVYLEQGTQGYWNSSEEWDYRFHYSPVPEKITITYRDGTVLTGSYEELNEQLNGEISYSTYGQYDNPWGVGTHTASFSYLGTTVEYDVVITPSRIESISVLPVINVADRDGWTNSDYYDPWQGWIDVEWYEYPDEPRIILITFTDGTEFTGNYWELQQLGYVTYLEEDQHPDNQWGTGVHSVTLMGEGFQVTYDVEIVEAIKTEEYEYGVLSDGSAVLLNFSGYNEALVTVPETVDGYTVRVLHMLQSSNRMETLVVPSTVEIIDQSSFRWCYNLQTVRLYAKDLIIGADAFADSYDLETVVFYGTEEEAESITILDGNDYLRNAQWRYATECAEHEYDDACDAECNICFATREVEHAFEWVVDYVGDCVNDGWKHEVCELCGATRNWDTSIPADGTHDNTRYINEYAATCGAAGYTGDLYCDDCYNIIEYGEEIPALEEHIETERINAYDATCGETGYTGDLYCYGCGTTLEYGEEIPALEHAHVERIGEREATCGETGYTGDLYCYDCYNVIEYGEEIPQKDHTNTEWIDEYEATCSHPGYTGVLYCNDCGTILEYGEEIPALGHTNTEWIYAYEATCGQTGYTGDLYCYDCETIIEYGDVVPATGNHGALTVINAVAATCNEMGYTGDVFCKDCGTVVQYGEDTPATGKHIYDNGYDADCNECGAVRDVALEPAKLTMNSVTGYQGETIRVDVSIEGNTGFAGLQFAAIFDDSYLTLKTVETQMEGFYVTVGNSVVFDAAANHTADGVIATLVFEVAEDAPVGDYPVRLRFMSGSTEDFEAVVMSDAAATLTVESAVVGDANGDGKVDTIDLVMLRRYLASMDPITKTSEIEVKKGADCNDDGVIDAIDLAYVRQYLASMTVN